MIPVLYPMTERAFVSNGLGCLPDGIECIVTEERNGSYALELQYPVGGLHFQELAIDRIIYAAPAPEKDPQPFRIQRVSKPDEDDIVSVIAPHVSYQLSDSMVLPIANVEHPGALTYTTSAVTAMRTMLRRAVPSMQGVFAFSSDITLRKAVALPIAEPVSIRNALGGMEGSVIDLYGGELEFDRWDVRLHKARGKETNKVIRYGYNMESLSYDTDATGLVTAYVGYCKWEDADQGSIVISGYVVQTDNADKFAYLRIQAVDFTEAFKDADGNPIKPTSEEITAKTREYAAGAKAASELTTSIEATPVPDTMQDVYLCDIVTVVHPGHSLQQRAKVVKTVFDVYRERYTSLTVGTLRKDITDTIANLMSRGG